jgi:membrane-bound lytic murein transglycosylase A
MGRKRGWIGKHAVALAAMLMLGSCGPLIPRGVETPAPRPAPSVPPTAQLLGVARGPSIASLAIGANDAGAALAGGVVSCPQLLRREDASGLTRSRDWEPACRAAPAWPAGEAQRFFSQFVETATVGEGAAFATGYDEPEIAGRRTRAPGFEVPVYRLPDDLVRAWPEETPAEQRDGRPPLGRYDESGTFVPYYDRAQIEDGALAGRGLEIAWICRKKNSTGSAAQAISSPRPASAPSSISARS